MPETELAKQPSKQDRIELAGIDLLTTQEPEFIKLITGFGLKEPANFIPGYEATIYFLDKNSSHPLPSTVRFRAYGMEPITRNTFTLDPSQVGVLEFKQKKNSVFRTEFKNRQASKASIVNDFVHSPQKFETILLTSASEVVSSRLPTGKIDRNLLEQLAEGLGERGSLFPSLIIARRRRHWVMDDKNPDKFRVTLDDGIRYYGYPYEKSHTLFFPAPLIGVEPNVRVEIKIDNSLNQEIPAIATDIRNWLDSNGISPPVRKKGFQVYFRHTLGVPDRFALSTLYLTKEIPGREIEAKLTLESQDTKEQLASVIMQEIKNGKFPQYRLHEMLPHSKETTPISLRYGVVDVKGKVLGEAFVITTYTSGKMAGLKRKFTFIGQYGEHNNILDKEELKESIKWPSWTETAEEETIKDQAKVLGVNPNQIFLAGTIKRERIRVNIENIQSDRTYVISIEDNVSDTGKKFRQIEIEYGDRRGSHLTNIEGISKPQIIQDIEEIQKFLMSLIQKRGGTAKPEAISKFDWLMQDIVRTSESSRLTK